MEDKEKAKEKAELQYVKCCANCKYGYMKNLDNEDDYICENKERGSIIGKLNQNVYACNVCGFYE